MMILFTVSLIELLQNKCNLLQLVIALEKYHTNGNPEQRSKSIGIIGTVIYEVMNLGLDSKACVALSRFFVSKLRDVHCVLQAIRAIYALIKYHSEEVKQSQNKGDECLSIIINGISSPSIHIPAYNQKVRIIAFKSYEYILNNYREFFKVQRNEEDISKEDGTNDCSNLLIPYSTIISAVLTAIESEKDPRNLIVSFELTRLILSILGNDEKYLSTIEPFLEEIFENISLYYPIEFEPPQNDKFKITSKELKDKLNRCFTSSPLLASYSFPFMLEKLSSASSVAKKESLKTLKLMVNELPIKIVRNYCEMIWNHLQNEAFNSFDEAIQTDCIEVIASLCAVLSSTKDKFITVQYDSIAEKVISEVFERCNTEIEKDPDTLTGILAFNILKAIMKKSSYLCYFVINSFMINYSLKSINETNLDSEKGGSIADPSNEEISISSKLNLIISFLKTLYDINIEDKNSLFELINDNKKNMMFSISKGFDSRHLLNKLNSIRLFKVLCLHNYFSSDEIKNAIDVIRLEYRSQQGNIEFMKDVLSELKEISNQYPYEIHSVFAEDVEIQYHDFKIWRDDAIESTDNLNDDHTNFKIRNSAFSSLGNSIEFFFEELEVFCKTKECLNDILYLCATDFYNNLYIDNIKQHIWTKEYLDTACRIVDDTKLGQSETDEIVEKMIERVFLESKRIFEGSVDPVFMSKEYAEPFYHLLKQSIKALTTNKAEVLLSEILKIFAHFKEEFQSRVKCYDKVCNKKSYYCMNMSLFKIFKYLLKYKEISIIDGEILYSIFSFLNILSMNAINTPALNNLRKEANISLCILANKSNHSSQELNDLIDKTINVCCEIFESKVQFLGYYDQNLIAQSFALIKGLAIKGSPKSFNAIQNIINSLKDTSDDIRDCIVSNWYSLFSSHDFSRRNKFNISPTYKQRMFSIAFPALIQNYRETQENLNKNKSGGMPVELISKLVIPICSESSYDLYKDYISELLPLIIYSLRFDDPVIKSICLKMIKGLLEEENTSGFDISQLIENLIESIDVNMPLHIKNLCLDCLTLTLKVQSTHVLNFKKNVISKVKLLLDDKKRSTRKLAVKCINDWSIS